MGVSDHARLAAQDASDRVECEQWHKPNDKRRLIKDERYGDEPFCDLVGNHSTVARQNGWPGGDKQSMEHGAGCMESERIADFGLRI